MARLFRRLPPPVRRWRIPIAIGITVTTLIWIAVTEGKREAPPQPSPTPVVIARTSIPAHTVLRPEIVAPWNSRGALPDGAFANSREVIGLLTLRDLQPGEVITRDAVSSAETLFGAAAMVPPGMRALTIVVPSSQGFNGKLIAGSRVDVIAVIGRTTSLEARTILPAAKVLHIRSAASQGQGALAGMAGDGGIEVTLAVPVAATPALALAQVQGQLMLALHSPGGDPPLEAQEMRPAQVANAPTPKQRKPRPLPGQRPKPQEEKILGMAGKPPVAEAPTQSAQPSPLKDPPGVEVILGEQRVFHILNNPAAQGGQRP